MNPGTATSLEAIDDGLQVESESGARYEGMPITRVRILMIAHSRLIERVNKRLGHFADSLALTSEQQAIFSYTVSKVTELAEGVFAGLSPTITVCGSVRSGLASALRCASLIPSSIGY